MDLPVSSCLMEAVLTPPAGVQGMVSLNKDLFKKTITVVGLTVSEKSIGKLVKKLKKHVFSMRNMKSIKSSASGKRLILLDPNKYQEVTSTKALLDEEDIFIADEDVEYSLCDIELGYDNWSAEEVLKSVFPDDIPAVTGFSVIGHVAHLNLRELHTPYKAVIGQVLLDKHKNLQSVVNKTDSIDNTYRNFAMELLAGKDDMNVTVKENGCLFQFDFSKVYWNSRLGTEHERIISEVTADTVVYDVFAGVGPFAVPSAKKKATVYCNDLNPHSYESLCKNLTSNKVKGEHKSYNMDGRQFIREVVKQNIISHLTDDKPLMVIMNLPALAIEFLDAFLGLLSDACVDDIERKPVMVHCYCFSKVSDNCYQEDVAERINKVLTSEVAPVSPKNCRRVRNVAPNKEMMCAEFSLSWTILTTSPAYDHASPVQSKKLKLDTS